MIKKIFTHLSKMLGFETIGELAKTINPCPICNGPAKLIEIVYLPETEYGCNTRTRRYTVECADFEDHGLWTMPGKCNFHGHDGYYGKNVKLFSSPWAAVKHWNEVVVPIGILTKKAMERYLASQNERN